MTATVPQVSDTLAEGIALLIDLAERGEINPWDVQVIEVIDRYLSKLAPESNAGQADDFKSLSQSGQAFLYASILVWLKADNLAQSESEEDDEELPPEEDLLDGDDSPDAPKLPWRLEKQLRRRGVAPRPRKRQVTLGELIEQLQLIGAAMEKRSANPRPRRTSRSKAEAAKAIAELAHQENLVETARELEQFLREKSTELAGDWLEFEGLLKLWPPASRPPNIDHQQPDPQQSNPQQLDPQQLDPQQPDPQQPDPQQLDPQNPEEDIQVAPNFDRVGVFWALLLLSSQSKVELAQDEFYQDLKLRTINSEEQQSMQS